MKELLRKKSVRISILLVTLLVVMGIVGINVRSAQRRREYDGHVEAAEKYLTELDYEQAIAEYMLALEIEPDSEEALNALEQIYQDYAQNLVDAGDYEKAVSILKEGYEQTGRESLPAKIEEFQVMQEEMLAKEAEMQEQKRLEEEQRKLEEEQKRLESEAAAAIPEISSLPISEATVRVETSDGSDGSGSNGGGSDGSGISVAVSGGSEMANIWMQIYDSGSEMTGGHIGRDGALQDTVVESTDAYGVTYRSYAFDDPVKNVQSAMDALTDYMTANPDAGFTALVKKSGSEIIIVTYPALFPNGMEGLKEYPNIDLLAWVCYIIDGKLYILCADETFDWLEGTPRPDLFIPAYLTNAFNAISSIL